MHATEVVLTAVMPALVGPSRLLYRECTVQVQVVDNQSHVTTGDSKWYGIQTETILAIQQYCTCTQ
jgi:hypothetical protein